MGKDWTTDRVSDWLIADMRSLQGRVLIVSTSGITGRTVLDATSVCLGEKSVMRAQLLAWATAQTKSGELSFSESCRVQRWKRRSADRNVGIAKKLVAEFLNERDRRETEGRQQASAMGRIRENAA